MSAYPHHLRAWHVDDMALLHRVSQQVEPIGWSEKQFQDAYKSACHGWVLSEGLDEFDVASVDAFIVYSIAAGECQLLNLCVRAAVQRHGHATVLMRKMMLHARANACSVVYLEVRASNTPAQTLYESLGFEHTGRRLGYYPKNNAREDALLYRILL